MTPFDRLPVGQPEALGSHLFEADAIVRFARRFDPLALRTGAPDGAPAASPWHVAAVFMKLNVAFHGTATEREPDRDGIRFGPSPGVSDMEWPRPVRAGDRLVYTQTVTNKRRLAGRPGWGLLTTRVEAHDQSGNPVFSMTGRVMVRSD